MESNIKSNIIFSYDITEKKKQYRIYIYIYIHLNKVLQKFSTVLPSSSVAKHKLLRDTKKQQDNVITSNRAIITS